MAMLRICSADGCEIKTLGRYCIHHETVAALVAKRPAVMWAEPARPTAAVTRPKAVA